jgi:hypothetical protein
VAARDAHRQGYDTVAFGVGRLQRMALLAASAAFSKTFGLLVTFIGIGIIVNVIIAYIAVQIIGERRQNREYAASRRQPPA